MNRWRRRLTAKSPRLQLALAEDGLRWTLNLEGKAGTSGIRSSVLKAYKDLYGNNNAFSLGLELTIPISNMDKESTVMTDRATLMQCDLSIEETANNLHLEIDDDIRNVTATRRQLALAQKTRQLSEKQLEIERQKLALGRSSNFQVLTYEDNLRSAQQNEVSAHVAYLTSLATLDQAMGTTIDTWDVQVSDSAATRNTDAPKRPLQRLEPTLPGQPGGALPPPMLEQPAE